MNVTPGGDYIQKELVIKRSTSILEMAYEEEAIP